MASSTQQAKPPSCGRISPGDLADRIRAHFQAVDHLRRGVCLLNAARFDEAAAEFDSAVKLGSTDQSLPSYLAACLMGQGRPADAAERLAAAPSAVATATHAVRRALALSAAGKLANAVEVLRSAIRDDPENPDLHFQLGLLLADSQRFEEAELRFTQALSIDRDHADALVNLALCCAVRSSPQEAVQHLARVQALRPRDARIALLLTTAVRAARHQGLAVHARGTIPVDDPDSEAVGIEELGRIIENEPEFVDAFMAIPLEKIDQRVFEVLGKAVENALQRNNGSAELHFHHARVLDRLGKCDDAIASNERAIRLDPTYVRALIELGRLYARTDRADDAATRLEQAVRAGGDYADVHFLLGNVYRNQGNLLKAKTAYRRALTLNVRYEAAQQALTALPV